MSTRQNEIKEDKVIKKGLVIAIYTIGRSIYRTFSLNRIPYFQQLAISILSMLLTQKCKLQLSLKKFASCNTELPRYSWVNVKNATVIAGSRLIVKNSKAYIPALQNKDLWNQLNRFKLQEESQIIFQIDHADKSVVLKPSLSTDILNEECFSALSPFSASWVHWLFEMFPQLLQLNKRPDKDKIKILVESNAPAQIYETITTFFPAENIVTLPSRDQLVCSNLLILNDPERSWSILWEEIRKKNLSRLIIMILKR